MADWREKNNVIECHRYMLENEIECDVSFEVGLEDGNTETIRAHKYILAARSPVFFTMCYDVEPAIFSDVLQYIYCESIDLTPGKILRQMYVSEKYILSGITSRLADCINHSTACQIWQCGVQYDKTGLAIRARELILKNAAEVLKPEIQGFLNLPRDLLKELISSDDLALTSEGDICNACLAWAEQQCKDRGEIFTGPAIREALGDCLYAVRFPLMPAENSIRLTEAARMC